MKKFLIAVALTLCVSITRNATLIIKAQDIASTDQDFTFALPRFAGNNGVFTVYFSGDFNEDAKNEFLIMSFAGFTGLIIMSENGVTNTIAGIAQNVSSTKRNF